MQEGKEEEKDKEEEEEEEEEEELLTPARLPVFNGYRIRTETHEIEGYGHILSDILQEGVSTAQVNEEVHRILKEGKSYTSPASSSQESFTPPTTQEPKSPEASFSTSSVSSSTSVTSKSPRSFPVSSSPALESSSTSASSKSLRSFPVSLSPALKSSVVSSVTSKSPRSFPESFSPAPESFSTSESSKSSISFPVSFSPSLESSRASSASSSGIPVLTTPLPPVTTAGYRRSTRQTPTEHESFVEKVNLPSLSSSSSSSGATITKLLPLRYDDASGGWVILPAASNDVFVSPPADVVTYPPSSPPDSGSNPFSTMTRFHTYYAYYLVILYSFRNLCGG
ncbi:hypothetical protein E2C01_026271 [Portunus trituberculatus]|uniref:Uncharacterized protein n=1 Tax=Portunus trituberculatus TaxID=210409 RepID=A0A5B7EHR2_PORTR|nr:hypothetical protein [Portunus trituberculatus]